jgi:hypothetical protein
MSETDKDASTTESPQPSTAAPSNTGQGSIRSRETIPTPSPEMQAILDEMDEVIRENNREDAEVDKLKEQA